MKKKIVVISGPSGSGKNTILQELLKTVKNSARVTTATTREKRAGEKEGVDYYFLSKEDFKKEIQSGGILEYRYVPKSDTYYGTYKKAFEKRQNEDKTLFCQMDIVGAKYMKKHFKALCIFILPESLEILEERIRQRGSFTEDDLAERLKLAKKEIQEDSKFYDYILTNKNGELQKSVENFIEILKKERFI